MEWIALSISGIGMWCGGMVWYGMVLYYCCTVIYCKQIFLRIPGIEQTSTWSSPATWYSSQLQSFLTGKELKEELWSSYRTISGIMYYWTTCTTLYYTLLYSTGNGREVERFFRGTKSNLSCFFHLYMSSEKIRN